MVMDKDRLPKAVFRSLDLQPWSTLSQHGRSVSRSCPSPPVDQAAMSEAAIFLSLASTFGTKAFPVQTATENWGGFSQEHETLSHVTFPVTLLPTAHSLRGVSTGSCGIRAGGWPFPLCFGGAGTVVTFLASEDLNVVSQSLWTLGPLSLQSTPFQNKERFPDDKKCSI